MKKTIQLFFSDGTRSVIKLYEKDAKYLLDSIEKRDSFFKGSIGYVDDDGLWNVINLANVNRILFK